MRRILFMVSLISSGFGLPAEAQQQQLRVSVPVANVRLEPSTSSPVIAKVELGTVLRIQRIEKGWARVVIVSDGLEKQGYILMSLGRLEPSSAPDPNAPKTIAEYGAKPGESPAPPAAQPPPMTAPVEAKPEMPSGKPSVAVSEQRPQPARPSTSAAQPGQFGIGAQLGVNPGGLVPSVLYDLNRTATIRGMFNFGSGYSSYAGQLLYRFHRPPNAASKVVFTPYVGGGLFLINVDYGIGSESFTGGIASGGVSFTFKSYPRIRYSVDLNMPFYSYGDFAQPAVYGIYLGLGGHYFF